MDPIWPLPGNSLGGGGGRSRSCPRPARGTGLPRSARSGRERSPLLLSGDSRGSQARREVLATGTAGTCSLRELGAGGQCLVAGAGVCWPAACLEAGAEPRRECPASARSKSAPSRGDWGAACALRVSPPSRFQPVGRSLQCAGTTARVSTDCLPPVGCRRGASASNDRSLGPT